jgi:hypothetical protein
MHVSLHDFYDVYDALKMVPYELKHVRVWCNVDSREFTYMLCILFGDLLKVFLLVCTSSSDKMFKNGGLFSY